MFLFISIFIEVSYEAGNVATEAVADEESAGVIVRQGNECYENLENQNDMRVNCLYLSVLTVKYLARETPRSGNEMNVFNGDLRMGVNA